MRVKLQKFNRARQLARSGLPLSEVSRQMGLSVKTISKWWRELKPERRSKVLCKPRPPIAKPVAKPVAKLVAKLVAKPRPIVVKVKAVARPVKVKPIVVNEPEPKITPIQQKYARQILRALGGALIEEAEKCLKLAATCEPTLDDLLGSDYLAAIRRGDGNTINDEDLFQPEDEERAAMLARVISGFHKAHPRPVSVLLKVRTRMEVAA
jgi:transposase-like protein